MTQLETRTEPMVVNFGPHHPSMHGVLRLVVTLDGEDVVDCEPVIGYLHRGMEKIAENRTNVMFVPYVSRMDYAAGMFYEAIVVNAPERLANVPVPKRASYIRVLMLELKEPSFSSTPSQPALPPGRVRAQRPVKTDSAWRAAEKVSPRTAVRSRWRDMGEVGCAVL